MSQMNDLIECGDFEIYLENDWWIIRHKETGEELGKFLTKDDALDKAASFLQDDDEREEYESVC